MIRKLKIEFIVLAMLSLFILLLIIVSGMNILNYNSVAREADEVLSIISKNKGVFPDFVGGRDGRFPPNMSPELPYESRYSSVLLSSAGEVVYAQTNRIFSVNMDMAVRYQAPYGIDK